MFGRIIETKARKRIEPEITFRFWELRTAPWAKWHGHHRWAAITNRHAIFVELGVVDDEHVGAIEWIRVLLAFVVQLDTHGVTANAIRIHGFGM